MTKISRRNLIIVAAGSAATLACKPGSCDDLASDEASTARLQNGKNVAVTFGSSENYGEFPERHGLKRFPSGSATHNPHNVTFIPSHACLVYIKLNGAAITAEHAYFPITKIGANEAARKTKARAVLAGHSTSRWGGLTPIRPESNFANFWFGSQQEIYFFIDNGTDAEFDPNYILVFTRYGASEGRPKWNNANDSINPREKKNMNENNAFFNAAIIDSQFLMVKNWFTNDQGRKFTLPTQSVPVSQRPKGEYEEYSMNIHIRLKAGTGWIPIVIDPDTGNNGGWSP